MPINTEPHPIFRSEHRPGQCTTRHRSVENARLAAQREGKHAEAGTFTRDWDMDLASKPNGEPKVPGNVKHFKSPSGTSVKVEYMPPSDGNGTKPINPHDVMVEVNGKRFSRPAAAIYTRQRFGIEV